VKVLLGGLWARRGLNLACLVVVLVAVSAALLGPMYGRASAEHLRGARIDQRAPYTTGLTFQVPAMHETGLPSGSPDAYRPPDPQLLIDDARAATLDRDWRRYWQRPTPWLYDGGSRISYSHFLLEVPLYWRRGMCSLAEVTGRCPEAPGAALVVECGQHFKQATSDLAVEVALDFLGHYGLIDREVPPPTVPPRRFELLRTHVIQHESFAFVRPLIGFETFAEGELIATDGPVEIRALCDDCTIFMPARKAIVGREGVYLTKPID